MGAELVRGWEVGEVVSAVMRRAVVRIGRQQDPQRVGQRQRATRREHLGRSRQIEREVEGVLRGEVEGGRAE